MPFCPSSLPGRSKINIISKLGYAQTTSFYKKPKYYLICTVSPVPSSQIIYGHRLYSSGGKEIRMQEVYEEVYALFFNSCEDKKVPDWAEREVAHPCLSLPYRDSELG